MTTRAFSKWDEVKVHLRMHTPPVVHFSKILHRGCMDFKWSSLMLIEVVIVTSEYLQDGGWGVLLLRLPRLRAAKD